jgi:hypothetical protein
MEEGFVNVLNDMRAVADGLTGVADPLRSAVVGLLLLRGQLEQLLEEQKKLRSEHPSAKKKRRVTKKIKLNE